ncbi:MAG TPA: response regulator [Candidatus Bathyarchaeia archaeon]|nr:response regulator [Candidatus Bathyarchaeia archaeon]
MINELPLYFHPTEVILIDDDVNYSKNVETIMLGKEVPIRIFNDPKKALSFIKKRPSTKFLDKSVHFDENEWVTPEKAPFNIDLNTLHHEIYNKDRFNETSVLIVDYAMPGLSGEQFFEKIRHATVKKILLTGEEGYEKAVKMFNSGLIDRFFRKSDDNLFQELVKEITNLKINFFQKISHSTLLTLEKMSPSLSFKDSAFTKFFFKTVKQNNIVEYYALDRSGSYLLIDSEGKTILLIVKTEEDMQTLYEIASEDEKFKKIVEDLKNRKKLAFFPTAEDSIAPIDSWPLYDATRLVGDKQRPYYYALLKNPQCFKPESKIYNYAQFLEDNS